MRLVDEQHNRRFRSLHLVDQPLESVLEFALDTGTSLQQREVERADRHVAQRGRHIALGHPQSEALHHGRLAHAGLTHQHRIVLPTPRQDVDNLPDLGIARQHGVHLAAARVGRQVYRVLIEERRLAAGPQARSAIAGTSASRRRNALADLLRDFRRATDNGVKGRPQRLGVDLAQFGQRVTHQARQIGVDHQRENRKPGAHLTRVVVERPERPSLFQHLHQGAAEHRGAARPALHPVETPVDLGRQPLQVKVEELRNAEQVVVAGFGQLQQIVFHLHLMVAAGTAQGGGAGEGGARLVVDFPDQGL